MFDPESLETIAGTIGNNVVDVVTIATSSDHKAVMKAIRRTTTPPTGENPRKWRRKERNIKFFIWIQTMFWKKLFGSIFGTIKHIFTMFTAPLS